jgi:hypothetical protein
MLTCAKPPSTFGSARKTRRPRTKSASCARLQLAWAVRSSTSTGITASAVPRPGTYAVDESDIKEKRDLYLEQCVASPRVIRAEYLDVLEQCRKQARLDDIWIRRAGVAKLRRRLDEGLAEEDAAANRLSRVKPTTLAGVAALIEYVSSDFKYSCPLDWQRQALATATAALKAMNERR